MKKNMLGYQKTDTVCGYQTNLAVCKGIKYSIIEPLTDMPDEYAPDFDVYFDASQETDVDFCPGMVTTDKKVDVDLWLSRDFPLSIQDVAVVLQAVAPASEDIQRLAEVF